MSTKKPDVKQLVDAAHRQGALSTRSLAALDIPDLGAQIQAGLGVAVDDVTSTEVVLVTMMPDDSGSIRSAGNEPAVRDGHNGVLDALARSRQATDVLVHTRYLNGTVLTPYTTVVNAPRMDAANYQAIHSTPLYDQTVVLLGTVLVKTQELADAGVPARTVTLLITDGGDCTSYHAGAADVAALVADLLAAENHIVAALGIDDGRTDFRAVFRTMGIPDRWILTPAASASEVRRAFQVFSQSAVAASQGGSFSKTAFGGFTN